MTTGYEPDTCAQCGDPIPNTSDIFIVTIDGHLVTLCPICYADGPDGENPAAVRH